MAGLEATPVVWEKNSFRLVIGGDTLAEVPPNYQPERPAVTRPCAHPAPEGGEPRARYEAGAASQRAGGRRRQPRDQPTGLVFDHVQPVSPLPAQYNRTRGTTPSDAGRPKPRSAAATVRQDQAIAAEPGLQPLTTSPFEHIYGKLGAVNREDLARIMREASRAAR